MRRVRLCALLPLLVLSCLVSTEAHADIPPDSAAQATQKFADRRDALVRRHVKRLSFDIGYWKGALIPSLWGREGDDSRGLAMERVYMASAVLWVLSHPSDFMNDPDDAYYKLQGYATTAEGWSKEAYRNTRWYWIGNPNLPGFPGRINVLFKMIYYFADDGCYAPSDFGVVGTNCDYDLVLIDLAHLIYTYRDGDTKLNDSRLNWPANPDAPTPPDGVAWTYADFLTNEMIYNIICQNTSQGGPRACEDGHVPYAFMEYYPYARFATWSGIPIPVSETENHVLSIITWDYLVTNWVMWQGSLFNTNSRRNNLDQDMYGLMMANASRWFAHKDEIYERVLEATGRVVHSGMYETNSRPYGRVSLAPLLALANFADPDFTFDTDIPPATVKRGARNAVDYLAAKYAFQSMRGKRQGPMRRRHKDYKKQIDFYNNNGFVTIMSLLSGAYEWDDCIEDTKINGRYKCPMLR